MFITGTNCDSGIIILGPMEKLDFTDDPGELSSNAYIKY